jgi:predicted metal-binding membrane protein
VLLVLAALGWAVTVFEARSMRQMADMSGMPGMPGMPGASSSGFLFLSVWTAMMVAMMFPSVAPAAAAVAAPGESRRQAGRPTARAWSFLFGYLTIWSVVGVVAYLLSLIVPDVGMAGPGLRVSRPAIGALILIIAGVYQWSPLKTRFLGNCRSPLGFVRQEWGTGVAGAFRLGIAHGAQCVGCCGALMLVLLAVGMMDLAWMALVAAIIFAEKVVPSGPFVGRVAGAAFLASGIAMVVT